MPGRRSVYDGIDLDSLGLVSQQKQEAIVEFAALDAVNSRIAANFAAVFSRTPEGSFASIPMVVLPPR